MVLPSKKQTLVFVWGCNYYSELGLGDEAVGKMIKDLTELSASEMTRQKDMPSDRRYFTHLVYKTTLGLSLLEEDRGFKLEITVVNIS